MAETVTWPMVFLALITAIPSIIAAFSAYKAREIANESKVEVVNTKTLVEETKVGLKEIHLLVDGNFGQIKAQLKDTSLDLRRAQEVIDNLNRELSKSDKEKGELRQDIRDEKSASSDALRNVAQSVAAGVPLPSPNIERQHDV